MTQLNNGALVSRRPNPKAETRRPKEGRSPKPEAALARLQELPDHVAAQRLLLPAHLNSGLPGDRITLEGLTSDFGFRPSFGLRPSGFGFDTHPAFPLRTWRSQ